MMLKIENNAEYQAALSKRSLMRARLEQSAEMLATAQQMAADLGEKIRQVQQALAAADKEEVRRLEAALVAGGPATAAMQDVADIGLSATIAKRHASITSKALEPIQAAHAQHQANLEVAESVVAYTVDRLIKAERESLAAEIERKRAELENLGPWIARRMAMVVAEESDKATAATLGDRAHV
jgi:hypothetical protein